MEKRVISMLTAAMLSAIVALSWKPETISATGLSDVMPVGGAALVLETGVDLETLCQQTNETASANYANELALSDNAAAMETMTEEEYMSLQAQSITYAVGAGVEAVESVKAVVEEEERLAAEEAARDPENFSNLVIAQVTNYVNVRDLPSEEGEVVGKLYDDSVGEFLGEENGWYKISSGRVTGYVKGEYCVTGEDAIELAREVGTRMATVNTTTLKVRTEATTESSVLGLVPREEDLVVLEEVEGWVKVSIEEGEGYVSAEYVVLHTEFVTAESRAEEEARLERERQARLAAQRAAQNANVSRPQSSNTTYTVPNISGSNALGVSVAQYACQFVGNPYVYGGSSLTNGTDCSGFVMSVYKAFGVNLPHSSSADRSQGYAVEGGLANAQPGDIICYSGHVGIYIGNGQIVHASTSRTGICISNASYRSVLAVRRIF